MVKALSIVGLFGGLRMDEILRLRVGCTRENWNLDMSSDPAATVCNLDVPVNKTESSLHQACGSDSWQIDPGLGSTAAGAARCNR